jgi:hypothetical protein
VPSQPKQHQEQWEGGEPKGRKKKKKKTCDSQYSYFIDLWLVGSWLRPATPEALLIFLYLIR